MKDSLWSRPQKTTAPTFTPVRDSPLQRKCACGKHTVAGGDCAECRKKRLQRKSASHTDPETAPPIVHEVLRAPGQPLDAETRAFMEPRFGHDFSQVRVHTVAPKQIQTRLTINQPGDKYEQEADRVAEQVMRMPEPGHLQRKCACGGTLGPTGECAECKKIRLNLQRRATNQTEPATVPSIVHEVLRSPGQPLDAATRALMESRFGYDFSQVRVHSDAKAAESARALNALAYTVGRDVVLGIGEYAPRTHAGKWLLAHELAHTVQQAPRHTAPGSSALSLQQTPELYIARIPCLNPDRCSSMNRRPQDCLPLSCGFGRSGVCRWIGMEGRCCCLGAIERTPEDAESRVRELLPAWIIGLLSAAALALIVACFASGVCEAAAIAGLAGAAVGAIIIGILSAAGIEVIEGGEQEA